MPEFQTSANRQQDSHRYAAEHVDDVPQHALLQAATSWCCTCQQISPCGLLAWWLQVPLHSVHWLCSHPLLSLWGQCLCAVPTAAREPQEILWLCPSATSSLEGQAVVSDCRSWQWQAEHVGSDGFQWSPQKWYFWPSHPWIPPQVSATPTSSHVPFSRPFGPHVRPDPPHQRCHLLALAVDLALLQLHLPLRTHPSQEVVDLEVQHHPEKPVAHHLWWLGRCRPPQAGICTASVPGWCPAWTCRSGLLTK